MAYNDTPDTQSHGITLNFEGDQVKGGVNQDSVSEMDQDSEGYTNKERQVVERSISTVSEALTTSSTQTSFYEFVNASSDTKEEDTKWLSWMEIQFKKIAGSKGFIELEDFKRALGVKKSFFSERFFTLFDVDKSGSIECSELIDGIRMLTKGTPAQKLKFLFDVYDINGSGAIDRCELRIVLQSCMEESSLSFGESDLDLLTDALFTAADKDGNGIITFEELQEEIEQHPGVMENLALSAAKWLKPPEDDVQLSLRWTELFTYKYLINNLRRVAFIAVYIVVTILLTAVTVYNHWNANGFVIVARVGGMNLNLNCSLLLVFVLRNSITYLRATILAGYLPLDQHIEFHKLIGRLILLYAIIHTVAHIGNAFFTEFTMPSRNLTTVDILFTTKAGVGYVAGSAYITGWLILVTLLIIFVCSLPFVRRGGYFEIFYRSHMLYIPFWVLLLLHGPVFWMFFVGPGLVFVLEKISRSKLIKKAKYGGTFISEVNLLPSGVCHLVISRPDNFTYRPGDYIFIQIPVIAAHEWHPFTISSAPQMKDILWLHVRSAGNWTKKLYKYFSELDPINLGEPDVILQKRRFTLSPSLLNFKTYGQSSGRRGTHYLEKSQKQLQHEKRVAQKNKRVNIKCFIDGPYGTASREIFETEHAVLISAGIGVTPMASILQSIAHIYKESTKKCPRCHHSFYSPVSDCGTNLKKVDFIWVNREQKSFEWFWGLLNHIEKELLDETKSTERLIDMHLFMTSAQSKTDMKGLGLQIALDLLHRQDNKDLITGLQTRTKAGRPDWQQIFDKISQEREGKVKVFFCGSPQLGKIIKGMCMRHRFNFVKENF